MYLNTEHITSTQMNIEVKLGRRLWGMYVSSTWKKYMFISLFSAEIVSVEFSLSVQRNMTGVEVFVYRRLNSMVVPFSQNYYVCKANICQNRHNQWWNKISQAGIQVSEKYTTANTIYAIHYTKYVIP